MALGLAMYLSAGDIDVLLSRLTGLADGSVLVADVLLHDAAGRSHAAAITAQAAGREPWRWHPTSSELGAALAARGWRAEIVPEAEAVPSGFWEQQRYLRPQGLVQLIRAHRR